MSIDWQSSANHLPLNPRMPPDDANRLRVAAAAGSMLTGHVLIATSGSTARNSEPIKLVAISKSALLASAAAVNRHLQSGAFDTWMHALPDFHVGGIGIRARSYLSGARVRKPFPEGSKWGAAAFCEQADVLQATLSALVPTQLYDIVRLGLRAPPALRAIVIGGDRLDAALYSKARALGWNILPSYGMTEAGSQIATAALQSLSETEFPRLQLLDNIAAATDAATGCLKLKGTSLLTGYCVPAPHGAQLVDPKQDGWFVTADLGRVDERWLIVDGRRQDVVKIAGENVNLARLDAILAVARAEHACATDLAIAPVADARLGNVIELACSDADSSKVEPVLATFNTRVLPYERIRAVHYDVSIARTALGKLNRSALTRLQQARSAARTS